MPGQESLGFIVVAVVMVAIIAYRIVRAVRGKRDRTRSWEKQEAPFTATFPELQPYFHPRKALDFVAAWRARPMNPGGFEWTKPPGLGVPRARFLAAGEKGQPVELVDAAGAVVSRFLLLDHDEGGVIRIGPGKLTANVRDAAVRYWHPEREFKWSRAKGWRLITQLADRPIDSTDRGTTFSSSSSDSPSVTTTAAAAAATGAVLGAGGAFDGGGASESWDGASESRTSY